ncbi:MAG: B12-binding domain-containing radical SAM protein [Candidatus Geothermarchaeales archaeon]
MRGRRIVLVNDRSLMSNFRGNYLFGFLSCGPYELIPRIIYDRLICPPVEADKVTGEAKVAECGLRRVEAALLREYERDEVLVAHPNYVERAIGEETKIVGIGAMDPLGIGPVTSSVTSSQNTPFNRVMFRQLIDRINPLKARFGFKTVLGGAGAWQLRMFEDRKEEFQIDHLVEGEVDSSASRIFSDVEEGTAAEHIRCLTNQVDEIPLIQGPTVNSLIEAMRGCGRGCAFCDVTRRMKRDFEIPRLQREARVNLDYGFDAIWLHSDEMLLYGCDNSQFVPNRDAIVELFGAMKSLEGTRVVGSTHWTLSSVTADPELIAELSNINGLGPNHWVGVQPGLETAAPRIVDRWLAKKVLPFSKEEWPWVVQEGVKILNENHYYPALTLIVGFPGETAGEVRDTIELVESLSSRQCIIAPLLYVDYSSPARTMTFEKMNEVQFELYYRSWHHNLRQFSKHINMAISGFNPILRILTLVVGKLGVAAILAYLKDLARISFRKTAEDVIRTAARMAHV